MKKKIPGGGGKSSMSAQRVRASTFGREGSPEKLMPSSKTFLAWRRGQAATRRGNVRGVSTNSFHARRASPTARPGRAWVHGAPFTAAQRCFDTTRPYA